MLFQSWLERIVCISSIAGLNRKDEVCLDEPQVGQAKCAHKIALEASPRNIQFSLAIAAQSSYAHHHGIPPL